MPPDARPPGAHPTVDPPRRVWRAVLLGLGAVAALGAAAVRQSTVTLNHDVATYAHAVRSLLDGGWPYVDFIQLNPPLALLLYLPSGVLERGFGVPWRVSAPLLAVLVCGAAIAWWADRARREGASATQRWLVAGTALVLGVWFVGYDLGQRDYYTAMLILPWLATAAAQRPEGREDLAAAAVAAIGIAMKPHFLAIWGAVLVGQALAARSLPLRPTNALIGALLLLYGVGVLVVFPQWWLEVVPLARSTYFAFQQSWSLVLGKGEVWVSLVALGITGVGIAMHRRSASFGPLVVWWGAAAGAAVAYLAQKKGWTYQAFPLAMTSTLLWAMVAGQTDLPARIRRASGLALVLQVGWLLSVGEHRHAIDRKLARNPGFVQLRDTIARYGAGRRVMPLASSVRWVPLAILDAGAHHHGPVPSYWMLPGLYRDARITDERPDLYHPPRPAESRVREWILGGLRGQPDLLVIEGKRKRRLVGDSSFVFREWLAADPRIEAELEHYLQVESTVHHLVYVRL